eukprot:11228347-Lingulodinium_polyedra.AAC.1
MSSWMVMSSGVSWSGRQASRGFDNVMVGSSSDMPRLAKRHSVAMPLSATRSTNPASRKACKQRRSSARSASTTCTDRENLVASALTMLVTSALTSRWSRAAGQEPSIHCEVVLILHSTRDDLPGVKSSRKLSSSSKHTGAGSSARLPPWPSKLMCLLS